jgi:selenocysteine lyase/cysteine desulfurase
VFVERYLQTLQRSYANTHTEDDVTGRSMSRLLHEAEAMIKAAVNAGPQGRIVACGTGATGAIDKLQQILGVALPPATRRVLGDELRQFLGDERFEAFRAFQQSHQPVVFVGPYEHHSNEVTWRQGLATVVEVNLAPDGGVDLAHLESLLQEPEYQGRCASARSRPPRTSPACARRCARSRGCCTATTPTPASTTRPARRTRRST